MKVEGRNSVYELLKTDKEIEAKEWKYEVEKRH